MIPQRVVSSAAGPSGLQVQTPLEMYKACGHPIMALPRYSVDPASTTGALHSAVPSSDMQIPLIDSPGFPDYMVWLLLAIRI